MVTGRVSAFQERFERPHSHEAFRPVIVWDFRLERQDDQGQPLPRVAVEMKGTTYTGTVTQGDWVRIDQEWEPGTTLRTDRLTNLTTNSTVIARGAGKALRATAYGFQVFSLLVVLAIFAFIAWIILSST